MISTEVNKEMAKVDIELAASPYVGVYDYRCVDTYVIIGCIYL